MDILRIKKGFDATLDVNQEDLPALTGGATYRVAIYSRSLDKRYVAQGPTYPAPGILRFKWPHGTKSPDGIVVPDTTVRNGTANMEPGKYFLEIFATDKSVVTDNETPLVEVVESNMLAVNSHPAD